MIEISNITKKFEHFICLDRVSMTIPDGTIYGLVGENGAGKSTLLRLIADIYRPDEGEIRIDGDKLPHVAAKQKVFYMPDSQYYEKKATPLTIGGFYRKFYPEFAMEEYRYLLEQFGLDEGALVETFSKGMKKQMFIGAAICANTKYLLCDEVFDGLDPQIRITVNDLLKNAAAGRNMTILIVSHYLEELNKICSMRGFLHRGRVLSKEEWDGLALEAGRA
ncbi:MAG: ABC transporter ATP-binding protein [Lachnospiraceae bacterium]|nr:ABC transporter ATP-binding protein [Lachnospiraceae bacterium]MDE6184174.1 ABC transporter ATP-binding protein [Lachnospiraceae bacterium]